MSSFVECAIVQNYYFKFIRILKRKLVKIELETVGITFGQFQSKVCTCNGRKCAKQI